MDCERCKRPRKRQGMGAELPPDDPYEHCVTTGDAVCRIAAASYKRGVRKGVEVAKSKLRTEIVSVTCMEPMACRDWSDVDAEVEALCRG